MREDEGHGDQSTNHSTRLCNSDMKLDNQFTYLKTHADLNHTSYNILSFHEKVYRCMFACSECRPCAPCKSRSLTVETTPVPPSQSLGVLCFPLSPPIHKGATHYPYGTSSSQLASQGRATTPIQAEKTQIPTSNQSSYKSGSVTLR
jgi:hypothetical protein